MQYLTLIHIDPALLAELPQDEYDRLMRGCFAKADALRDAGCLHGSQQLLEPATARTLRVRDGVARITDGPFAETRELVAGFWLWQVRSLDEAVEWLKRAPFTPTNGSAVEVEIRPFFEAEDFGAAFTPELQAQEQRLREQIERNN